MKLTSTQGRSKIKRSFLLCSAALLLTASPFVGAITVSPSGPVLLTGNVTVALFIGAIGHAGNVCAISLAGSLANDGIFTAQIGSVTSCKFEGTIELELSPSDPWISSPVTRGHTAHVLYSYATKLPVKLKIIDPADPANPNRNYECVGTFNDFEWSGNRNTSTGGTSVSAYGNANLSAPSMGSNAYCNVILGISEVSPDQTFSD